MSVGFYTFLKSLHYEEIVFGQDDDKSVGPGPVPIHQRVYNAAKARKYVVFHGGRRSSSTTLPTHGSPSAGNGKAANGVTAIDHAEKGQTGPKVVAFDQNDPAMMEAVRNGEATVVDVPSEQSGGPQEGGMANGGMNGASNGLTSGTGMDASRQEMGGIGAPASNRGGCVLLPSLRMTFADRLAGSLPSSDSGLSSARNRTLDATRLTARLL